MIMTLKLMTRDLDSFFSDSISAVQDRDSLFNDPGPNIKNNGRIQGSYPGGKNTSGIYQLIINEIRPHELLIIPFLGKCGVLTHINFNKVIGIDKDQDVIDYWKNKNLLAADFITADSISLLPAVVSKYADTAGTVIYCDPPYPIESRKSKKKLYKYEMTNEDHIKLLKFLTQLKCDVLINTYPNKIYSDYLRSWNCLTYKGRSRQGGTIELLYMNYKNEAGLLHDYRYLGSDRRQREWIKNKIKRLTKKLLALPAKERNAIIDSVKAIKK